MDLDPWLWPTHKLADVLISRPRACTEEPELFFAPGDGDEDAEDPAQRQAREKAAAVLCEDCPVRVVCLEWALRTEVTEGVWAGYTTAELGALRGVDGALAGLLELSESAH